MDFTTDYLDRTALRLPDKCAFTDDKQSITFSQLREESRKLGTVLCRKELFQKPVCIYMDKGPQAIASMLGVTASGNFYTVLDTSMPAERIHKILSVLQPCAVITDDAHKDAFLELYAHLPEENACEDTEAGVKAGQIITITYEDAMKTETADDLLDAARSRLTGEDIMFVLFTSGSTGVPKGVIILFKAFPPYLEWYENYFHYTDRDVLANQTPFYYIMSCPDIYLAIKTGATCYIVPRRAFSFPMMTMNLLKEHHVTVMEWVPSALSMIADFNVLPEVHLDDLRLVLFGGEVMNARALNMWREAYPEVRFFNGYGLTETTEVLSWYEITETVPDDRYIPIGKPVDYLKALILDENNAQVLPGETGELCAAGVAIAAGYYRMPEKTAQVFTDNPLYKEGDDPETRRMYRTGDLVRMDESGNIIYMGRKDFQIKHMGNRIELGEIEMAAAGVDGVKMCCCHYDTGRQMIVIFYTGSIDEDSLNDALKSKLPSYMIPGRMEHLDKMPLNTSGKTDRAALKKLI